jgi:hypothetical protein
MTSIRLAGHRGDNPISPERIRKTETENGYIGFVNNEVIARESMLVHQ